jgi:hypothetical protein
MYKKSSGIIFIFMISDFDLGTGSIVTNTSRFVNKIEWLRDKETKEEKLIVYITETVRQEQPHKLLGKETYLITLNDTVSNSFRGHNNFLTDLKNMTNQCLCDLTLTTSSSIDLTGTGSIRSVGPNYF